MDKVLVIGPVLSPITFQQYLNAGESIRPGHQIYFSRLIEAIGLHHPIQVLSIPPQRKTKKERWIPEQIHRQDNVVFVDFSHPNLPLFRTIFYQFQIRGYLRKLLKKSADNFTILVDLHHPLSRHIIKPFHRHARVKTIGIIQSDHPSKGTKTNKVAKQWIKKIKAFTGSIGQDENLLHGLDPSLKKRFYLPGIVDIPKGAKKHPKAYFFYSGTLDNRHGIDLLIRGFLDLHLTNMDLLIAGTGPDVGLIEQIGKQHRHVKYLGVLHPIIAQKYQAGAYANINPEPPIPESYAHTMPSKIIDYLSSGAPTLSTRHPWLEKHVNDQIFWIENASIDGMRVALDRFLKMDYALAQSKAIKAKQVAVELLNANRVGQDLLTWMSDLK
jgi:glycosyltransferase involved in cell wall biosynthesis